MFKEINDKFGYLNRQTPRSGSNSPPPPNRSNLLYSQSNIINSQLQANY
jgi:hypothetical protein